MKQALTVKKQVFRLGLLSSLGILTITGALWFSGQLRLVEQFTLPAGAIVGLLPHPDGPASVRVAAGATVVRIGGQHGNDIFYPRHSLTGYSFGTHDFEVLRAGGTHYHWRLQLGTHTIVGS